MQSPAPIETVKTIDCPVNLRKDSLRILGSTNDPNSTDKDLGEVADESQLSVLCSLDIECESQLEVSIYRKKQIIRSRKMRISECGIGVSVLVDLAPSEDEVADMNDSKPNTWRWTKNGRQSFLSHGDIIEFDLVPIIDHFN